MSQQTGTNERNKQILVLFLLLVIGGFLLFGPLPTPRIGNGDFTGYWSASYLLAQRENFSDPLRLDQVERQLAHWTGDFTLITWNPPWLLSLLLPLTAVSFDRAVWLWLLTNITMIFVGTILAWVTFAGRAATRQRAWIAPLIGFAFVPTLIAISQGQVNILIFFGLALFLFLESRGYLLGAGAALVLTTIKPHIVYITTPLLLLRALYRRSWRLLFGFGLAIVGLTLITFLLRPSFLSEYSQTTNAGNLLDWQTPTVGGIVAATWGWQGAKLMGIVILPLVIIWWWYYRNELQSAELVPITLLISVATAPFGWSYDQVVLLIPIVQIVVWVVDGRYSRPERIALIATLIVIDLLFFYQRTHMQSEVEAFWSPLAITLVYAWAFWRKQTIDQELPRTDGITTYLENP